MLLHAIAISRSRPGTFTPTTICAVCLLPAAAIPRLQAPPPPATSEMRRRSTTIAAEGRLLFRTVWSAMRRHRATLQLRTMVPAVRHSSERRAKKLPTIHNRTKTPHPIGYPRWPRRADGVCVLSGTLKGSRSTAVAVCAEDAISSKTDIPPGTSPAAADARSQLRREMGFWDVLLFNIAAV